MKTQIIRIGNSQGILIPETLLEESGISGEVEILARKGALVICGARRPRSGWEEAFREMAARGDDVLLNAIPSPSSWDKVEWQWPPSASRH